MTTRKSNGPRKAQENLRDELKLLEHYLNAPLMNLDLIGVVEGTAAVQEGRAKGGENAAKARTEKWHSKCEAAARELLTDGIRRPKGGVVAILAERFCRDPKTIREVLKKAGIR